MRVVLSSAELFELDRQPRRTKSRGGFQSLFVGLQERVERRTRAIVLTAIDRERIARYAFAYGRGGWEDRLLRVFGRVLGPSLGRIRHAA